MKSLVKIAILLQCLLLICVWCEGSHHTNPSKGSCGKDEGIRYALTDSSSACLDGSKPVFYYRKATSHKSKKWLLFFEGGGWCYTFDDCFERSQMSLGSTKQDPNCSPSHFFQDHLSNNPRINPMMHDWNMVYIRYCDGSSYAGNTVVTQQGKTLHFHGKINREETIKAVLSLGMKDASDVVISGCSAGGLAVYLGIDQMTQQIHSLTPTTKVRGLAISGFFPNYDGEEQASVSDHGDLEFPGKSYRTAMQHIFHFMNITTGTHPDCVQHYATHQQEHNCMFARYVMGFLHTAVFSIQSQYDHWTVQHILQPNASYATINHFGQTIQQAMRQSVSVQVAVGHGLFLESCFHHCLACSAVQENTWSGAHIMAKGMIVPAEGKSGLFHAASAFAMWYHPNSNSSGGMLFLQDAHYPCHDCCLCTPR